MVPVRTYLFGGGAAVALIAGALAAFLLITSVVSEGTLQDGTRAVVARPPDTLNIGGPGGGPGGLGGDGEPTQSGSGLERCAQRPDRHPPATGATAECAPARTQEVARGCL